MKTLISKYWLVLMALVSVTLFTACSSDDDAVTPVFPQVQTIGGAAGAELDFTFDANESWSLSSEAERLVRNPLLQLYGLYGHQYPESDHVADPESHLHPQCRHGGRSHHTAPVHGDGPGADRSLLQLFLVGLEDRGTQRCGQDYLKGRVDCDYGSHRCPVGRSRSSHQADERRRSRLDRRELYQR